MIYLIVDGELVDILTEMDEALAKAKKLAEHAGKVEIADLVTGRRTIIKHVEKGKSPMSGLGEEVKREKESLRGKAPSLRSPIAEAVIQAYADGYTAGSLRQPSDAEVDAALRYLLRQGLLREGITIMAAKFAVSGMCSAMAEALEKEES